MLPIGNNNGNKQNQNRQINANYNSIPNFNQRTQHQRQHQLPNAQVVAAHTLAQHQFADNQQTTNITTSQQMNFYEQLQRLHVAQANQMSHNVQDNHSNQHQAGGVLRAHPGFQQNTHPIGTSQLNTSSLHTPSTSSHRPNPNVLQARNMNESKPSLQTAGLDVNIAAIITEINAGGGQDTIETLTEKIASSLKPFEVSQELANEKKTLSDSLEVIEKDRKHSDMQVNELVRRVDRLQHTKDEDDDNDEDANENAIDSEPVWLKITKENRQTAGVMAEKSHVPIKFGKPHYVEPRDAPGMRKLMEKHRAFRPQLIKYLTNRKQEEDRVLRVYSEAYCSRMKTWKDKLKKWEDSSKKRVRDEKHRAIFENTFPDLKKAREDKERSGRTERTSRIVGSEFMSIAQKDGDEKKMRNAVAIPPHLCKMSGIRKEGYFQNTHLDIKDASSDNKQMIESFQGTWTTAEESMFSSRYREAGKNFSYIAEFLPDKSISDCVLYYYLAKTRCNFKAMYRKKRKGGKVYKPLPMPTKEEVEMYRLNRPLAHNDQGVPTKQELRCCKCQQILDSNQLHGRSARDASDMYVVYSNKTHEPAICHKCRETVHKDIYSSRCLVKTCTSKKGTKASKYIPPSFMTLGEAQRAFLHDMLGIPHELFKLCGPCLKELNRRIDMVIKGECEEQIIEFEYQSGLVWSTDESMRLASHYSQIGPDFEKIAARMPTRSAEECRLHLKTMEENGELTVPVIIELDDDDTQMGEVSDELHSIEDTNEDVQMNDNSVETIEDVSNTPPSENIGSVEALTPVIQDAVDTNQTATESSATDVSINQPLVSTYAPAPSRESFGSASDFSVRVGGSGGSITAGTPIRPPSISVVEHLSSSNKAMSSVPQQFLTSLSRSASNRGTPQPSAAPTPQLQLHTQQNTAFQQLQYPTYQVTNKDISNAYLQNLIPAAPSAEAAPFSSQWLEAISKQFVNVDDTGMKQLLDSATEEGTRMLLRALIEQRRKEREAAQQQEQLKQREEQQQRDVQLRQQLLLLQQQLGTSSQASQLATYAALSRAGLDINTLLNNLIQPAIQNATREPEQPQPERVNNENTVQGQAQQNAKADPNKPTESLASRIAEVESQLQELDRQSKRAEERERGLIANLQAIEQKFGRLYSSNNVETEHQWSIQRKQLDRELQICGHLRQTFRKQIEDAFLRRQQLHRELASSVGLTTPHSSGLPTPSGSFSMPQFTGNASVSGTNQLASAALLKQHMTSVLGTNKVQSSSPLLTSYPGITNDRSQSSNLHTNQPSILRGSIKGMSLPERAFNDDLNSQQSQQHHQANSGQVDVVKRKSGIETVMKLSSVQSTSRHPLTVPHMRRPHSPDPNTAQQLSTNNAVNQPLSLNTSMDASVLNSQLQSPRIGVSSMSSAPGSGAFRVSSSTGLSHHQLPSQLTNPIPTTGTDTLNMYLRQHSQQMRQQSYEQQLQQHHQKLKDDHERERARRQREKELKEREERQRKELEDKIRREEERKKQEERERAMMLERQKELQRQQQAQMFHDLYRQIIPGSGVTMTMASNIGMLVPQSVQLQSGSSVISSAQPQTLLNQNVFHQIQPQLDGNISLQQATSLPNFSALAVSGTGNVDIGLPLAQRIPTPSAANPIVNNSMITLEDCSDISDDETPPGCNAIQPSIPATNNETTASDQLYTLLDFAPDDITVTPVAPVPVPRIPFLPPVDPSAVSVNLSDTFECVSDDDA